MITSNWLPNAVKYTMIALIAAVPFQVPAGTPITSQTTQSAPVGKSHAHHAPHKGTLVELGEEFAHLELVLDRDTGKLTAYALDGEAENSVRLNQPSVDIEVGPNTNHTTTDTLSLEPVANPLTGETSNDTSEYCLESVDLKGATKFPGLIVRVVIKGAEFKNVAFRFPEGNE